MSLVRFKDGDRTFDLGSVSMNFLDNQSVFDKYQEDNDEYYEVIFKTSKCNVISLSRDILIAANSDEKLRNDIREKLIDFSKFVKESNDLICEIA